MKRRIEIGILYSRSGSYQLVSDACRMGAMHGQIVEMGTRDQVFSNPRHPYTEAVPVPDPARRESRFARLDQEIPSAPAGSARHL